MRRFNNPSKGLPAPQSRRRAFTLVELLVVIGIIAVLVSILIPVVGRARRASRNVACLANLRSLQSALISYVSANRHAFIYQSQVTGHMKGQLFTWEGALQPILQNAKVRFCAEATESSKKTLGAAFEAYGTPNSVLPLQITNPPNPKPVNYASNGSYTFNGFLYYPDPNQYDDTTPQPPAPNNLLLGGYKNPVPTITKANVPNYWFSDITTLDGGAIPASVLNTPGVVVPPGFGPSSSVPAFGDGIELNAWPQSASPTVHDPTPKGFQPTDTMLTGDTVAAGDPVGRYCISRHPGGTYGGANIVFLDGSARTVPLRELWYLRWNKSYCPPDPKMAFP